MITTYRIEVWNPEKNQYEIGWSGSNFKQAEIMFNKPYYQHLTRRLIKQSEEVLYREKKK